MRPTARLSVMFAVLAIAMFAFSGVAGAATWRSSDTVIVPAGKIIDDDLYVGGGTMTIDGDITGNLFVGGGNVTINGNVGGSLYACAGTVVANGTVVGDLIAMGGQVTLNGAVEKNILACGGTISVTSAVRQDVLVAGGQISVGSKIGRDVLIGGGTVALNGSVGRNAVIATDTMTIKGPIAGNLDYYATKQSSVASGTVKGKVDFHKTQTQQKTNKKADNGASTFAAFMFGVFWFCVFLAGRLIVGAFFVGATPKAAVYTADAIKTRPWASLGIGALVIFFAPTLMFILFVTLIGMPASFILCAIYWLAIYMSMIVSGTYLGRLALTPMIKREPNAVAAMALGVTVLGIITGIPFLGWLISFVSVLFGTGALTLGMMALIKAGQAKREIGKPKQAL